MKRVFIIHGYTGYPDKNWFPWLRQELQKQDIEVVVPAMPHTEAPQLSEWLPHLQQVIGAPDADTFLVGHSLGCIAILRYLEMIDVTIGGAVLVAGFAEPIHFSELNNFFETPLDEQRIKNAARRIVAINSDNDEHVPLWQGENIAKKFGAHLTVLHQAGHINEKSGFKELPLVLTELEKMLGSTFG